MSKEQLVNEKEKCCGCGLCAYKCPKHAITMKEDEYGFVYPYIDKAKCVNCGACRKICEYNKRRSKNNYKQKSYIAVSKNKEILNSTASGGVFTSIAKQFIASNGVVYGCSLIKKNGAFIVKHVRVTNNEELNKTKGSKYVQSNIMCVFDNINKDIENGKKVLFSGTPCQVSTIKRLTNNSMYLYTIDIICHGVPNVQLFNDYIKFIENKKSIKIEDYRFRVKEKGWGLFYGYHYNYKKKSKDLIAPAFKSSYYQLFLDSYVYRENCYSCPFSSTNREGDITIGDYWGIEKEHPEVINTQINPEKGVSCVIINSPKGEQIINQNKNILFIESDLQKIRRHNSQLSKPSEKPNEREKLLNEYKKTGYKNIELFYTNKNRLKNLLRNIWFKLPYGVRKRIKK